MVTVTGRIVSNLSSASGALRLQFPLFPLKIRMALGERVHLGTVNIKVTNPLVIPVDKYDMDTGASREERIKWTDDWVAERFLFKKCRLLVDRIIYEGWVYRPSSTPNSVDPFLVEVILEYIPDLKMDQFVYLEVDGSSAYIRAVTVI